jgi:hypothetical protein
MIEKDFGKFIGICDCCGEVTPPCDTWNECREYIKDNGWKTHKNKTTGEWENLCPVCGVLEDF